MSENVMLLANIGLVVVNCLLVHNCIKIYTEVVKYKIFKQKKEVV